MEKTMFRYDPFPTLQFSAKHNPKASDISFVVAGRGVASPSPCQWWPPTARKLVGNQTQPGGDDQRICAIRISAGWRNGLQSVTSGPGQ
jgi:hypothetical protein